MTGALQFLGSVGAGYGEAWLRWMIAVSWQVVALVAVVALADRWLSRRGWPQLRHGLWMLVPLKLVVPPALPSAWRLLGLPSPFGQLDAGGGTAFEVGVASGLSEIVATDATGWFLVWLAGGAVLGTAWVWRDRRLRRRLLAVSGPASVALLRSAARAAAHLGMTTVPSIRVACERTGPLVVGCRRPVVVLPASGVARWSRRQLEHVLCHELAHVRRRDLWLEAAFAVLNLVYWFHPLVWLARRRAAALRELCCDATVAGALGPAYRRTLLRVAGDSLLGPAPAGAGLRGRRSWMLTRLRELERAGTPTARHRRLATVGILLVVGVVFVPTAAPSPVERGVAATAHGVGVDHRVPEDPWSSDAELAAARSAAELAMSDASEYGSLHVRYTIMRLNALEDQIARRGRPVAARSGAADNPTAEDPAGEQAATEEAGTEGPAAEEASPEGPAAEEAGPEDQPKEN